MSNKELKQKLSELAEMKNTTDKIDSKINRLVLAEVKKTHPNINLPTIHCPFTKECKKSPFGFCVYDESKDIFWDNCIYCNEPYERK